MGVIEKELEQWARLSGAMQSGPRNHQTDVNVLS